MSTFDDILSPDLEGVLRDVAKGGPSSLLAVAPEQVLRSLRQGWGEVSVAQAGLRSAERHLLAAHRSELAWVLREAYLRGFYADEARSRGIGYGGELTTSDELSESAANLVQRPIATELGADELLGRVVDGGTGVDLLEASLRIERSSNGRVFLANEQLAQGRPGAAAVVASELLKEQPPALERLTAHQALALSLEARGDLAASLEQHRVAEGIAIRCAHPGLGVDICWVSQIYLACGLGDREAFERATRAIDASGVVLSATAESLLLSWDGPPVSNVLGNGARLTDIELQKALERGGPVTARIINALL